jgi:8-oxo-dGTP pyrophosphatase MutT (NUDIX family)
VVAVTDSVEVLRRFTARVLPVNDTGHVLLLKGFDPRRPDYQFWYTIGGAAEDGESLAEAGVRELFEEAGITASPDALTEVGTTETVRFSFNGWDITQDQTYFAVHVGDADISFARMDELERATTIAHRWWSPDELENSGERFHPPLVEALRQASQSSSP